MRIRFFTDLILGMFLVPLTSSMIFGIHSCLLFVFFALEPESMKLKSQGVKASTVRFKVELEC